MPRPKSMIKQGKSKKKKEEVLETADDYLAAGVEHEDAAGKWRAGDAVKALRFFYRALEVYDQGLRLFPQSLDLAYNRARVQLEVATHPLLVRRLEPPILDVLEEALASHRYALTLDPDNADTLFNTAQVLTTIAERLSEKPQALDTQVLKLLEEALDLQSKCLSIQASRIEEDERQAQEMQDQPRADVVEQHQDNTETVSSSTNVEDQWFSIVEPITQETLLDTIIAQLATLTTLCNTISSMDTLPPHPSLTWIEQFSSKLLSLSTTTTSSPHLHELALARANVSSSLLEAAFRHASSDIHTYKTSRDAAFSTPELSLPSSSSALSANAQSLIAFASALHDTSSAHSAPLASVRWNALSTAITNLTNASQLPPPTNSDDIAKNHMLRGDCSLLLFQLSRPPTAYEPAVRNAMQLLKNAEVFYRNASKLGGDVEEKLVASLRSSVARGLQGQQGEGGVMHTEALGDLGKEREWIDAQIGEMEEEGLL